jgi:hypothetical protein
MVVHALKKHNLVVRIHFCNWFVLSIHDAEVAPQLVFLSNEAWISLCGEVNSQNNRYCSANNLRLIHKLSFHDEKIGERCAINACSIIGHIIYDDTVNAARYLNNILSPFFCRANRRRKAIRSFPAGFCDTTYGVSQFGSLWEVIGDCVISYDLWLPSSPDLTPCDFYMW